MKSCGKVARMRMDGPDICGQDDGYGAIVQCDACEKAELRERIVELERENEVLRAELKQERARTDRGTKLLSGIFALLYPPPIKVADGRTVVFRPKNMDPHEVLQELSDRIRSLEQIP